MLHLKQGIIVERNSAQVVETHIVHFIPLTKYHKI